MARRVKARGFDAADLDLLAVGGRKGHAFRVLACPDGGLGIEGIALGVVSWKGRETGRGEWVTYDFDVAAGMVVVARRR